MKMVPTKFPCVYVLASAPYGTIYIGVTSDLVKRIWQHKHSLVEGFTDKYKVHHLVWCEMHASMEAAIAREKNLKDWKREWKIKLIQLDNPKWQDLYSGII
jgi:putative endonuclease